MNFSTPLDKFPLIRSRDIEEVREAIARIYCKPVLVPTRGIEAFDAALNNCRLQRVELAYCTFHAGVGLEFPETSFFVQMLPIRGQGEIACGQTSAVLVPGGGVVLSSNAAHKISYSADYEHVVLRIGAPTLAKKLEAMTGKSVGNPLQFAPVQRSTHPAAQMLQQYLPLLINTLDRADPPFPDWWVAQTEQLLMTLLLCGHQHNYSHLLEQAVPDAAPHQVRLAEEYLEANAGRFITLEELAEVVGVSSFSLFSAFKKYRGYSPLSFLAQVRSRR